MIFSYLELEEEEEDEDEEEEESERESDSVHPLVFAVLGRPLFMSLVLFVSASDADTRGDEG